MGKLRPRFALGDPAIRHVCVEQPRAPGQAGHSRLGNEGTPPLASERTKTEVGEAVLSTHAPGRRVSTGFREAVILELSLG